VISVGAAFLSGRAARSAAKYNSDASITNSKIQAETEAYNRARAMDIKTIERQDEEIEELRQNGRQLREKVRTLLMENEILKQRVSALEQMQGENHG
jgi:regulator of replication initiation timing